MTGFFASNSTVTTSPSRMSFNETTFPSSVTFVFITIGLVDAHTGEVLALAKPATLGDVTNPKAEKPLRKMLVKSLKKLPDAP